MTNTYTTSFRAGTYDINRSVLSTSEMPILPSSVNQNFQQQGYGPGKGYIPQSLSEKFDYKPDRISGAYGGSNDKKSPLPVSSHAHLPVIGKGVNISLDVL